MSIIRTHRKDIHREHAKPKPQRNPQGLTPMNPEVRPGRKGASLERSREAFQASRPEGRTTPLKGLLVCSIQIITVGTSAGCEKPLLPQRGPHKNKRMREMTKRSLHRQMYPNHGHENSRKQQEVVPEHHLNVDIECT